MEYQLDMYTKLHKIMTPTKRKAFLSVFFLFLLPIILHSQGTSGENASFESRAIIDMPTAGIAPKNSLTVFSLVREEGSVLLESSYTVFEDVQIGGGFVFNNLIGTNDIETSLLPLVHLKWRVLNERNYLPAITAGFSTFGRGTFEHTNRIFQTNSPGLYVALSKEWRWKLGAISTHAGVKYSLDPIESQRKPNIFFGLEQALTSRLSVLIEYNALIDDVRYSSGGLLNSAFRFSIVKGVTLEFQLRDILKNVSSTNSISRNVGLDFIIPL